MSTLTPIIAPVAIAVKTSSYTIPANRVAKCTVNLEGSATFTIDAVTALRGTQNTVLVSTTLPLDSSSRVATGTTFNANVSNSTNTTNQKTTVATVVLPAGTVISGTGTFRVVVEEYYA
jgi:hypothetical protein